MARSRYGRLAGELGSGAARDGRHAFTPSIRSWPAKPTMPSARYGRPAITPSRRAPWASACSTPSPSRRCTPAPSMAPKRVAVVDFDVHHGNGTQAAFWTDKDLFYGSTHQMPLFPGTGAVGETGVGNICNAPLAPGDDGKDFRAAWESRILPALDAFAPDFLLVSAGFDAHFRDPLAQLRLVEAGFRLGDRAAAGSSCQAYRRQARLDARGWLRPRCPGKLYGCSRGNADGRGLLILGAGKS